MLLHIAIDLMKATTNTKNTVFPVVCELEHEEDNFLADSLLTDVYRNSKISKHLQRSPFHQLLLMKDMKVFTRHLSQFYYLSITK